MPIRHFQVAGKAIFERPRPLLSCGCYALKLIHHALPALHIAKESSASLYGALAETMAVVTAFGRVIVTSKQRGTAFRCFKAAYLEDLLDAKIAALKQHNAHHTGQQVGARIGSELFGFAVRNPDKFRWVGAITTEFERSRRRP